MEENQTYETWDAKKILAGLLLFAIIALSFKIFVLDNKSSKVLDSKSANVQGTRTSETPVPAPTSSEDIKKNIETKLTDLKKEVNNINVVEIATSTPAVQKVLNDLKSLQSLPQSQAKEACFKICSGF